MAVLLTAVDIKEDRDTQLATNSVIFLACMYCKFVISVQNWGKGLSLRIGGHTFEEPFPFERTPTPDLSGRTFE